MAFGFAGAAAGAAESLDTLLAKRRAEALAQQELEQRRITEERMRKATEQQIAASKAVMAAAARTAQRQEGLTSLSYIPAGDPIPQSLAQDLRDAGLRSTMEQQETVPTSTINLRKLPQDGTPGGASTPLPMIPLAPEEWWTKRQTDQERDVIRTREEKELALENLGAVLNDSASTYADQLQAYVRAGVTPPPDPALAIDAASKLAASRLLESKYNRGSGSTKDDPRLPRGVKDYLHSFRYKSPPPGKDRYTYSDAVKEVDATMERLQEDHPSLDISLVIEELRKIFKPLPRDEFGYTPGDVAPGVDPSSLQRGAPDGWRVVDS